MLCSVENKIKFSVLSYCHQSDSITIRLTFHQEAEGWVMEWGWGGGGRGVYVLHSKACLTLNMIPAHPTIPGGKEGNQNVTQVTPSNYNDPCKYQQGRLRGL